MGQDLQDFKLITQLFLPHSNIDLNNSINLKKEFKNNNIFVAESGIKNQDDINALKAHDIHVFLIGESLMKGDFA